MNGDASILSLLQHPNAKTTILAGAGISMVRPSELPSGRELLEQTLSTLITDEALIETFNAITEEDGWIKIVPETIFQRVWDILGYLPMESFKPLALAPFNAVHVLLADASKNEYIDIFTTNFDCLIERAASEQIDVKHIHGSIDDPNSMFVTIRRVGRGLEEEIGNHFASSLISSDTLLVLGYSGNDNDVMHVISNHAPSQIVWLVRDADGEEWAKSNCERFHLRNVKYVRCDLADLTEGVPCLNSVSPNSTDCPALFDGGRKMLSIGDQTEILVGCLQQMDLFGKSLKLVEVALRNKSLMSMTKERRISLALLASHAENRLNNQEDAIGYCERARTMLESVFEPALDLRFRLNTQWGLALLDQNPPQIGEARDRLKEALRIAEKRAQNAGRDKLTFLGQAYHNLGYVESVAIMEGKAPSDSKAIYFYKKALGIKRKCGDLNYLQSTLCHLAAHRIVNERRMNICIDGRDTDDSVDTPNGNPKELKEFTRLCNHYNRRWDYAYFWAMLAWLAYRSDREDAGRFARYAKALFTEIPNQDEQIEKLDELLRKCE